MEREGSSQLELFSRSGEISNSKHASDKSFLSYIRGYEKTILIIIGMVISCIISFSLGVERGKNISMNKPNSYFDVAYTPQAPIVKAAEKQITVEAKSKDNIKINQQEQTQLLEKQGYVIQLASYKSKANAQKEIESLKKKGLSPVLVSKGNYAVVCVGNLFNRETAQSLLSELKKRYRDCYIRRL